MIIAGLVPLAAVPAGRQQVDHFAIEPGLPAAGGTNVVDPEAGNDRAGARKPAVAHHLAEQRQIGDGGADAAGGPRRAEPVDGDLGIAGAERLPDPLGKEAGEGLAGGALQDPAEKIRIGRLIGEALAMRPAQPRELALEALEIGRLVRWVPAGGHAVAGEDAGLVEIVLLEMDAA